MLRAYWNSVSKSHLVRRISLLSSGVAAGQAITLAASPLLTRIFDPHALGLFGIFSTIAFLVGGVSTLRYDIGIVLAKTRSQAAALFALGLTCTILVSTACWVAVQLGTYAFLDDLISRDLADVLVWAPLQIASIGVFLSASQWATRKSEYAPQATYQLTRALTVAILQLTAGYLLLGHIGLACAQSLGFLLAGLILLKKSGKGDWRLIMHGFTMRRMRTVARRFARLPRFVVPQDIATSLSQSTPYLVLGHFYGATVVGLYWLSVRSMQMPINFASQSIRQVFLQHLSKLTNGRKAILPATAKATTLLSIGGAFLFFPVIAFGPKIFVLVFGEGWQAAGEFSRWISTWMLTSLVKVPAWCVLHVTSRQKMQFRFEMTRLVLQSVMLVAFGFFSHPAAAVAAFALSCVLVNVIMIGASLHAAKVHDWNLTNAHRICSK